MADFLYGSPHNETRHRARKQEVRQGDHELVPEHGSSSDRVKNGQSMELRGWWGHRAGLCLLG